MSILVVTIASEGGGQNLRFTSRDAIIWLNFFAGSVFCWTFPPLYQEGIYVDWSVAMQLYVLRMYYVRFQDSIMMFSRNAVGTSYLEDRPSEIVS